MLHWNQGYNIIVDEGGMYGNVLLFHVETQSHTPSVQLCTLHAMSLVISKGLNFKSTGTIEQEFQKDIMNFLKSAYNEMAFQCSSLKMNSVLWRLYSFPD